MQTYFFDIILYYNAISKNIKNTNNQLITIEVNSNKVNSAIFENIKNANDQLTTIEVNFNKVNNAIFEDIKIANN